MTGVLRLCQFDLLRVCYWIYNTDGPAEVGLSTLKGTGTELLLANPGVFCFLNQLLRDSTFWVYAAQPSTGWILPFTFSILICFFSERSLQWETLAWLLFIVKMMAKISLTKISSQKQCCCQTLQTNYVAKCSTPEYNGHSLTESKILSLVLKMAGIILNRKKEGSNSFGLSLHDQMFQESSRDPYPGKRHVQ